MTILCPKPFLVVLVAMAICACASGSAIITGKTRAPIVPAQVKVYLEPPASFEVIGLVNASSDAGWTEQESMDYALEELKAQAGKLGANGVLIVSSGEERSSYVTGSGVAIPIVAKTLQAKAILVIAR